jgi:monooxygenase
MEALDHDVVVLGAGISGIDAAWHLKHKCPTHSFVVREAKQEIGGTWSLFKYPGIRSDSDMQTFGFHFKPWRSPKPIAPGEDIMNYLRETVDEFDLEQHIRYGTTVASARWSSAEQRWTLHTVGGEVLTCAFLFGCTGYYSHDEPYRPEFPGEEDFGGRIVHPQQWGSEDDAAYPGKRVAIIGSGATAVTMLPNIAAGGAAHVTMVQRTPTYIVAQAETDATAARLGSLLPAGVTHSVLRTRNVLRGTAYFEMSKKYPEVMKKSVLKLGRELLQGCEYGEPVRMSLALPCPALSHPALPRSVTSCCSDISCQKNAPKWSSAIDLICAWPSLATVRMPRGNGAQETFAKHFEPPYNPWDQVRTL